MNFVVKTILSFKINSIDDYFGSISDFYFNIKNGHIEYIVLSTASLLPGKKVLLKPAKVAGLDFVDRALKVDLIKNQIEDLPNLEKHLDVSSQSNGTLPLSPTGALGEEQQAKLKSEIATDKNAILFSVNSILNYSLETVDKNTTGHVVDLILDTENWRISDLIVTTHDWLPGKKIKISYDHVHQIDINAKHVVFDIDRKTLVKLAEFDEFSPVNKQVKVEYMDDHGRVQCHDHMVAT
jgi:sporulation protein YlmC with PRC-barrel domain